MEPKYKLICSEGEEVSVSNAQKAWQMATSFEFNGTRVQTPFAKIAPSSIKWYFLASLILWSLIIFGSYKVWTTTVRPFIWGPYEDDVPISIDPSLLEEQKHERKLDTVKMPEQTVVRRPVRKKTERGILDKIIPPQSV